MKTRNVAVCVFTDGDDVVVQDRRGHSRVGERYGFWGGQVEEYESPKQAVERELEEELGFVPEELNYWDEFSYIVQENCKYKDWQINFHVFLSPITPKLKKVRPTEGKGIIKMPLEKVIEGKGFPSGSTKFLENVEYSEPQGV